MGRDEQKTKKQLIATLRALRQQVSIWQAAAAERDRLETALWEGEARYQAMLESMVAGEEELQKLQAQLIQAQEMEMFGTLTRGVAHDFNNLLSTIVGFTDLALDEVPSGTVAYANLQAVLTASRRAKVLVQQLLAFSRTGTQERSPVELCSIVEETLTFLRAVLPATVALSYVETAPGTILADPTQIQQILMNLGINAAHAIGEGGGQLAVSLRRVELDSAILGNRSTLKSGSYLQLTVHDTGCGMSPEVRQQIFKPFFTTRPKGEGNGLGLAIVQEIVTSHDGVITVDSELEKGTTFHVYLPLIKESTGFDTPVTASREH